MGYTYNDSQMIIATQIAYLDFGPDENVGDRVDWILSRYGEKVGGEWMLKDGLSKAEQGQFNVAKNILEIAGKNAACDNWREWKVVDVCNDNGRSGTGYYGCVIETGEKDAIVACRGSESFDGNQVLKDWGLADAALLDSTLTDQQKKAGEYMEKIYYLYGDKYNQFSVTGHSLGGNLAQHMTIHAPAAMRNKIEHCISFDGPGFSQEYLKANKELIEKTKGKMDHYQWSIVGSLLTPIAGTLTIIRAHDEEYKGGGLLDLLLSSFVRHHTHNVEFDQNGNIIKGEQSDLAKFGGPLSRIIDHIGELSPEGIYGMLLASSPYPVGSTLIRLGVGLKLILAAYSTFREVSGKIKKTVSDLYYNYIAPQVSGSYEVNLNSLPSLKDGLELVNNKLKNAKTDLESVRQAWSYSSGTGAYYRSCLFAEITGLEFDINRLSVLADTIEKIVQTYSTADTRVANSFA